MRERNRTENRDEVLFAFHQECARPTVDQIIEWVEKYPKFAEDIRAHAAIARDWATHENTIVEEPDESLLAAAYSRALNIIYNVDNAPSQQKTSDVSKSFQEYFVVRGTDTPAVARALDIDRVVIADLVSGRMLPPIGKRLIAAVSSHLSITALEFEGAFNLARAEPIVGYAKADRKPAINAQSYEVIIRSSGMSGDKQKYWLDEN